MFHFARFATLISLVTAAASHVALGQSAQIELVADLRTGAINTNNSSEGAGPFAVLSTSSGPLALFPARDGTLGRVLWKSDGTTDGTNLVRDLYAEHPTSQHPRDFTQYRGRLYFVANTPSTSELWLYSTDGTACGTLTHWRIRSDASSTTTGKLTVLGDWLYYVGLSPNTVSAGPELHRTDGTTANTTLVTDLSPGSAGTSVSSMVTNGSRLFLAATVTPNTIGTELWISDGNVITPVDISAGSSSSNPMYLTILGDRCYFSASSTATGNELWKSDGTVNGTVIAADVNPGSASSTPTNLSTHDGNLYFAANGRDANNASIGIELFVYNGTVANLVADIFPGGSSSNPTRVLAHGPDAYFSATDAQNTPRLYRTRGTPASTVLISATLQLNSLQYRPTVDLASTLNGVIFRARPTSQEPFSLWVTDGSPDNATNISAVYPNGIGTTGTSAHMTPLGDGRVIFSGADRSFSSEPWISDGSVSGTFKLRNIFNHAPGSTPYQITPWNYQLTFTANNNGSSRAIYGTLAAPNTTTLLYNPASSPTYYRNISGLTPWSGGAAIMADSSTDVGYQVLNVSFPGATAQVIANGFDAIDLLAYNNKLLATRYVGTSLSELYISSSEGTSLVPLDPVNRPHNFFPSISAVMNDWLYFQAVNRSDGYLRWLWRTDGVITEPIVRLANGADNVYSVGQMARAGSRLFVSATTFLSGGELWTSDGTAQGTHIVTDLNPGAASGFVFASGMSDGVIGERLAFRANHPTLGTELFITDGTPSGTYALGDLNPGTANGTAYVNDNLQVVGSTIFVAGTSPEHGTELWMSDGSPNSLTRVTDLFPGAESSNPSRFTTDGEKLYFVAEGCSTGKELYTADTSGNVTLLAETMPGPEHGFIQHTYWFDGSLYFTYNHPTFGRELFRIRTAPCPSDFNADTIVDFFDYLDFVAAFAANEPAADFNADTVIDFFDYLDFVQAFASGC